MGKKDNNILTTQLWENYGIFPNSGKEMGHHFPSVGKYWEKYWEYFVVKTNPKLLFWENINTTQFFPNLFVFGT